MDNNDEEFVYEKRLKSEFDRWINDYDMLEARRLSKEADEKQKKELENLFETLKDDMNYVENLLKEFKEKGQEVYKNIEEEVESIINKVEEKFSKIKEKF